MALLDTNSLMILSKKKAVSSFGASILLVHSKRPISKFLPNDSIVRFSRLGPVEKKLGTPGIPNIASRVTPPISVKNHTVRRGALLPPPKVTAQKIETLVAFSSAATTEVLPFSVGGSVESPETYSPNCNTRPKQSRLAIFKEAISHAITNIIIIILGHACN